MGELRDLDSGHPRATRYLGSSCTGTDAATNRTLTYTSTSISSIMVQGRLLHPTDEYTLVGNVITFLVEIWDADIIHVWS